MKHLFEFNSITALTGTTVHFKSNKMFSSLDDEQLIRDMVERVFSGETVKIPGFPISMRGSAYEKNFMIILTQDGLDVPRNSCCPDNFGLLYIYGTANNGDESALMLANTQQEHLVPWRMQKLNVPQTPYAVDVLNPLLWPLADMSFIITGLSGQYSKAISCVAIDMLMD